MHSWVQPNSHIILRLPSSTLKIVQVIPNTILSIGKYGSFPANLLIGRPHHLTFDIIDQNLEESQIELRIVTADELHAEAILDNDETPVESREESSVSLIDGVDFELGEDGNLKVRSNRNTVDDPSRQMLSNEDIEELKKLNTGAEMVQKLMQSHSSIDEKTAFSLAKYAVRKRGKYLKRFTVLPMDVSTLMEWIITEKDAPRIMELRNEMLGLILSWSNIHYTSTLPNTDVGDIKPSPGRWLVIDETGGLIVAAMAEKMGILYPDENPDEENRDEETQLSHNTDGTELNGTEAASDPIDDLETEMDIVEDSISQVAVDNPSSNQNMAANGEQSMEAEQTTNPAQPQVIKPRLARHIIRAQSAASNAITLLHSHSQPNLALLKYFDFDDSGTCTNHPLYTHLKTLSWLQLLSPNSSASYQEPERIPYAELATWKGGKRSAYFRKRRRWERIKHVVDDTRSGDFDGLIVATSMEPVGVLHRLLPLIRGGAPVVVYNQNVEPLVQLADAFSRARRVAFLSSPEGRGEKQMPSEDFPIDPNLLLDTAVQTSRARKWQVLPGRTHPVMMGRGGAEGYVLTGTRVFKAEGAPKARGRFGKKRKVEGAIQSDADS
ncbi:MAG: tRNA (adenine(58)-N(1))-methyltransferase non-catalytic subunit trm6 [Bogoriella megaspora]|nr:MAG: tRNA (adenine(58)-N(1))-methyltransferase non-catalytic subunit trm6 [Bogoriella megaspora]